MVRAADISALAIGVANTFWNRDLVATRLAAMESRLTPNAALALGAIISAIFVVLALFVSRGRNRIVMWILIALFVLGLPSSIMSLINGKAMGFWIVPALAIALQVIAFALLFTPSARAWTSRRRAAVDLGDTFS